MRLLLALIFLSTVVFGQAPVDRYKLPGCVPVKGDFLYAAESEVTNTFYLNFIEHQRKKYGEALYRKLLPDTGAWINKLAYNEPYKEYYFRHPAYRDYPVVNVSHDQAVEFCEWYEGMLNAFYDTATHQEIVKVDVRLPTEEEWEWAARGGDPNATFPWKGTGMRNTDKKFEGDMMANFVRGKGDYMGVAGSLNDAADVTAPVRSYWPNAYGLYNMSGNVAEMVQQKGKTKGGSWATRAIYLEIDGPDPYEGITAASPGIGFRFFIEIIDRRPGKKQLKKADKWKFNARTIEAMLTPVNSPEVLVSKYEVTNRLYNQFLEENPGEEYQRSSGLWEKVMPYGRRYENDYASHPDYHEHPVVNISRESAVAFCQWLEERYNSMRRRKYNKLKIELPTLEQWEYAARGGLRMSAYPWGGPYARNAKAQWLCNFNPVEERWILDRDSTFLRDGLTIEEIRAAGGQDGCLVTAPVKSYVPNGYGAYNMSGNVAEIVADKDVVKGGSWGSFEQYTQIHSQEEYKGPSPFVGFRFIAVLR